MQLSSSLNRLIDRLQFTSVASVIIKISLQRIEERVTEGNKKF